MEKPDGTTDSGDLFWCSDCIDDEDMSKCDDCGGMFGRGEIEAGSRHGNVCNACHRYLTANG